MAAQTAEKGADMALTERLQLEVERAVQRSLKGIELLGAPPPTVGQTPKTVLHRRGTLSLYHYHATADEIYRVPILFVMAPTNKAYIVDLAPGQSLIEFLLGRGYDVYLMDWSAPSDDERHLKIDDYVLDFIPDCLRRVQQDSGEPDVSLVAYCAGGMLSVMYQSLHPGGPVKNLVCLTTPVDFKKMELFQSMSDRRHFDVDKLVDSVGVVPASMVAAGFDRPIDMSATRAGTIPGIHTVGFDAASDTIELSHTARDRRGFAGGALVAAKWVRGRQGWFTMADVLQTPAEGRV